MLHRHLDVPPGTCAADLGPAAIDDILERGDLDDWAPIAREIRTDPFGTVAEAVLAICGAHQMYGTSVLWPAWIEELRHRCQGLADLRRRQRLTQQQLAAALGITQSDVSKLERRRDIRLSSLRSYVNATGGRLMIEAAYGHDRVRIEFGQEGAEPG